MNEDETSEIIVEGFITESDAHLECEELVTKGFNRLV